MTAENTVVFKSVAYSGGVILGGWGLVEIFLRVDPFYALLLRNLDGLGWLVAGAACSFVVWHIAPGPLRPEGDRYQRWLLGFLATILGLLGFIGWLAAAMLPEAHPVERLNLSGVLLDQRLTFLLGALLATAVACAACPAVPRWRADADEPERVWPHWLGIPVVVAMGVFAVMLLLVSTGRVRALTEGDIAQEELRRGGLEFSMTSLQEALYLISPRSVELFRKANVDDDDILDALGAPTDFTGEAPLITSILARIDGNDDLLCAQDALDERSGAEREAIEAETREACGRIDAFIRLFRVEPDPNPWRQLLAADEVNGFMCFTKRPHVRDEATIESGSKNGNEAERSLCERLEDPIPLRNLDGAPPRPLLSYAFSGGHANVARCVLSLCGHPGSEIEIQPLSDDPAVDSAFGPSQSHIRFAINPYLALEHGRSAPESPWSPGEAADFESFLTEVEIFQSDVGLDTVTSTAPDARPRAGGGAEANLSGVHISHTEGRCRTRQIGLSKTGEGRLHDDVRARSYRIDMGVDGNTPLDGLLIDYGSENLRLVHQRPREEGGERLTVLDQVVREGALTLLSGTDTSLLLGTEASDIAESRRSVVLTPRVGDPIDAPVAGELGWETLNLEIEETGRIVLTGRAESDLCLEVRETSDREGRVVADAFVPHARTFTVETDVLRAGTYTLWVTALRDDPSAATTTVRLTVRSSIFCTHEAPEEVGIVQILGSGQDIAPYRVEAAPGNRLYCPFRSDGIAQVAFTAAAEADIQVRLLEANARGSSDTVEWTDSSGAGTSEAPARETVTLLVTPKRDFVFEVQPYEDAELTASSLEVSLKHGPAVTEEMLRVAVSEAAMVDPTRSVFLTPDAPPVAAARIAEDGFYTIEEAGDMQAFRFDPTVERPLSEIDVGSTASLTAGDIIIALSTGPAGGRVTIDPTASRRIPLGVAERFDALESGTTRLHFVEPQVDGPLEVILTPLDGQDLDLSVRNAEGGDLGSSTASGPAVDSVTVDANAGAPLIVEVSALGTSAYSLRVADVRESVEALPEVRIGEVVTRETLPSGQQLRFRLTADRAGLLTITLRPTQGDMDLTVTSLLGDILGASGNGGTDPDLISLNTNDGQIFIIEIDALEASGFSLEFEYK
ncbi:MAG: hypothetical protein HWE30_16500 [Methylocystaceae bacterium]|nr:hypothetical protein [Methylocystaceae bacterium]